MKIFFHRLAILFLFSVFSLSLVGQGFDVVEKGDKVPEFAIEIEDGKTLNISDYEGSVVFINFFATWCGPCRKELPFLQKDVWDKYKTKDNFKLMAIGRGHDQEEVDTFKKEQGFQIPMYGDKDKSVYTKFATRYIPRNYIIDADGEIVYASQGFSKEEFEKMVDLLDLLILDEAGQ
ncbi:TlpA family protein disulfide reductase [Marinilabilia rubra]|nr:TlpA disulfide reductase family protein [Marinilabilia rubra]